VKRAIFLGIPAAVPARLAREFLVLDALPASGAADPAAWRRLAGRHRVDLSASWLVLPDGAHCPPAAAGLFRGCLTATPSAAAAFSRIRAALRASRVVTDRDEAARACSALRRRRGSIVFTNGVFDLFHLGHLRLLQAARRLGGALVVGVNSDASARRLKGRSRPFVGQFARAEIVAGVRGVDLVVIFDEDDPRQLLRRLRPDVLAKGSEYTRAQVVGRAIVEGYGGRIALVPHLEGFSSTRLAGRLAGRPAGRLPDRRKSVQ
jgi:D-beta-D-heptose 7-phosphate kinase/D-beta-D-heptose 1-phosphate adenosyltransferase